MSWSFLRWQVILLAVVVSLVMVAGQDKSEAITAMDEQGKLTVVQMQFIDRFEDETAREFELDRKVTSRTLCDARLHYKKHKGFVERWEEQMIPPSSEHPRQAIWGAMWQSAEEYGKTAYAMKKEGARFSCDWIMESDVIEEVWMLMQNHTLKITNDPPEAVRALMRQFFVSALREEMKWLQRRQNGASIAEDIKWRLEKAKKTFQVEPFEVMR